MNRIQELRAILEIVEKYNPDSYEPIIPEHDTLYFDIPDELTKEDRAILSDCKCFEGYSGWYKFV